jgi:hypothetical protein
MGDAYDKQWTMADLRDSGASEDLINKLVIPASRVAENHPDLNIVESTWAELNSDPGE